MEATLTPSGHASAGRNLAQPTFILRTKLALVGALRRVWMSLPVAWTPWVFRGMLGAAGYLPGSLQARARSFVSRIRAEGSTLEKDYGFWIDLYDQTDADARRAAKSAIAHLADPPVFSILMPVFNPPHAHLRAAVKSVQDQFYPYWELCLADCSSADPSVTQLLRDVQARDPRIKLIGKETNTEASAALNAALHVATGAFIAVVDHDALISPRALYDFAVRIVAQPATDIIYSDEDQIDASGTRSMPYFKPDWNPELMLGQNLIHHLGVYRRDLVERVGGFKEGLAGTQDYDLALRAVAETTPDRIGHIAKVLYHDRQSHQNVAIAPSAQEQGGTSSSRAVANFLSSSTSGIRVDPSPYNRAWNRIIYPVPKPEPLVSVIIPSRNHADMLARTLEGLLHRTDYPALQVLIVDNGSDEPAALALLDRVALDHRVVILRCPGPFNYSALNNKAVREASGELILLLNNDTDVINPGWLREMVSHAIRPGIGAVGAKLLYPDSTIQHGGVTVGMFGVADHQYLNKPRDDCGYFGQLKLTRNVTAVTAACLMVRRQAFLEVGGLNEVSLPVAFNDVDLCLKLVERGYRNLWTPHAELYHLESASRGSDQTAGKVARLKQEIAYMQQRWGRKLDHDPYWNPNLSLHSTDIALAFPPRD